MYYSCASLPLHRLKSFAFTCRYELHINKQAPKEFTLLTSNLRTVLFATQQFMAPIETK